MDLSAYTVSDLYDLEKSLKAEIASRLRKPDAWTQWRISIQGHENLLDHVPSDKEMPYLMEVVNLTVLLETFEYERGDKVDFIKLINQLHASDIDIDGWCCKQDEIMKSGYTGFIVNW